MWQTVGGSCSVDITAQEHGLWLQWETSVGLLRDFEFKTSSLWRAGKLPGTITNGEKEVSGSLEMESPTDTTGISPGRQWFPDNKDLMAIPQKAPSEYTGPRSVTK